MEDLLEEVIERVQKVMGSEDYSLVYSEYNNLFVHCLRNHLSKAILLGKALDSDIQKNIPLQQ